MYGSETMKQLEDVKGVVHSLPYHYILYFEKDYDSIFKPSCVFDQSGCSYPWHYSLNGKDIINKLQSIEEALVNDIQSKNCDLLSDSLKKQFPTINKALTSTIENGKRKIVFTCKLNKIERISSSDHKKQRDARHKAFLKEVQNGSMVNQIHPLLAAHDLRLQEKRQLKNYSNSNSNNNNNSKNNNSKNNNNKTRGSNEMFTYTTNLESRFYGSPTMDQCKHCFFSNNCGDMATIQCDTCNDYTHFDCPEAIKAGENQTEYSWTEYLSNKKLPFDCVDCRKIKNNRDIDEKDKTEFAKNQAAANKDIEFNGVGECILWLKQQCLRFIQLSIKLHQKYIIDRTPPIFHTLADTWSFKHQKDIINDYNNREKTIEDVKTRGLDTFLELVDLHNEEYDNVTIDKDIDGKTECK